MDLGAEPPRVKKYCWVTLTGFGTVKKILKELPTVNCKAKNWDKDRSCFFFGAVEEKKKVPDRKWIRPSLRMVPVSAVEEFSACTIFFSLTACAGIFFGAEPLCTNFFFRQILLFFFNSEILIHYLCFWALYIILHSQQSKGYRPLECTTFSNMYTQWERRKPLWVDGFPVIFFSPCPLKFLSHSPS